MAYWALDPYPGLLGPWIHTLWLTEALDPYPGLLGPWIHTLAYWDPGSIPWLTGALLAAAPYCYWPDLSGWGVGILCKKSKVGGSR